MRRAKRHILPSEEEEDGEPACWRKIFGSNICWYDLIGAFRKNSSGV
jgi:hypothetical protein